MLNCYSSTCWRGQSEYSSLHYRHQMPIASAFLSNCSAMPQILCRFIIDASSTHRLKYAQPLLRSLLLSVFTSFATYHGALISIHERAMRSLSEDARMQF